MNFSSPTLIVLLASATLIACPGGDPGEPDGSGGDGADGGGGNDSSGGSGGSTDPASGGSGGKASGGSSSGGDGGASGGKGGTASGGGSGLTLEEHLDLAEELCTIDFVVAELEFGEREEGGDLISSRIVDDADTESEGREVIVRDDRLGGHHELSWELPVTDGETKPVTGFFSYGATTIFSKCFEGIARIRTEGYLGQYYVYASEKLFYADEDGTCQPMPETGFIRGCISDEY